MDIRNSIWAKALVWVLILGSVLGVFMYLISAIM